jgi:hypothetical protein
MRRCCINDDHLTSPIERFVAGLEILLHLDKLVFDNYAYFGMGFLYDGTRDSWVATEVPRRCWW